VSTREIKVHSDRDGRARCGQPRAREVSADREQVTCVMCLNLLDGAHGSHHGGYQWADVKPCGTTAAYRRHLRRQGTPVRCEACRQANRRECADAYRRAA
jgi:hypothetical protein